MQNVLISWFRASRDQNRPKGEQRIAQRFSAGADIANELALKGRPMHNKVRKGVHIDTGNNMSAFGSQPRFGRPFRAIWLATPSQGLKPWAILFSPFRR